MPRINHQEEVMKVYWHACLTKIRGLKFYIIEYINPKSCHRSGLAYGTTPGKAWKNAYTKLNQKNKHDKGRANK